MVNMLNILSFATYLVLTNRFVAANSLVNLTTDNPFQDAIESNATYLVAESAEYGVSSSPVTYYGDSFNDPLIRLDSSMSLDFTGNESNVSLFLSELDGLSEDNVTSKENTTFSGEPLSTFGLDFGSDPNMTHQNSEWVELNSTFDLDISMHDKNQSSGYHLQGFERNSSSFHVDPVQNVLGSLNPLRDENITIPDPFTQFDANSSLVRTDNGEEIDISAPSLSPYFSTSFSTEISSPSTSPSLSFTPSTFPSSGNPIAQTSKSFTPSSVPSMSSEPSTFPTNTHSLSNSPLLTTSLTPTTLPTRQSEMSYVNISNSITLSTDFSPNPTSLPTLLSINQTLNSFPTTLPTLDSNSLSSLPTENPPNAPSMTVPPFPVSFPVLSEPPTFQPTSPPSSTVPMFPIESLSNFIPTRQPFNDVTLDPIVQPLQTVSVTSQNLDDLMSVPPNMLTSPIPTLLQISSEKKESLASPTTTIPNAVSNLPVLNELQVRPTLFLVFQTLLF
jgi:hypothetical protein